MSPRMFDRYMVDVEAGRNLKLRRLTDSERCAFFLGVLPIAAKSTIRGRLLVGDLPAEPRDVAFQASVTERAAAGSMRKLRELGVLLHDPELDCETVHDFEDWNPAPRQDNTNAERQRRFRERKAAREAARNGGSNTPSNGDVTARNGGEVEEEEKNNPPTPGGGVTSSDLDVARERLQALPPVKPTSGRKRDQDEYQQQLAAWVDAHFPGCQASAVEGLIGWVQSRGTDPTPAALRDFAEAAPNFSHVLEAAA